MSALLTVASSGGANFARRVSLAFLERLTFLDDKTYLKMRYKLKMGDSLDLDNPRTFNEKLQWLKLHDRNPLYTTLVDKAAVKPWVAKRIGGGHVVRTLGVWDSFESVNFEGLPERFVLKCTHDSGGLAICRNRSTFDIEAARRKISKSLERNYYFHGREWPYKGVPPRVLAEEYLDLSAGTEGVIDYKFYCFNGEPRFLYVSQGLDNHATACISFVTLDWDFDFFHRGDYASFEELPERPKSFGEMLHFAKILSRDIPFVRVDFYDSPKGALFSEMTFFPCSGMMVFEPFEADEFVGQMLNLPHNPQAYKKAVR